MKSLILLTDSYKFTHWLQYPSGTTNVYSYLESRGGLFPQTVFFGLQYILKEYLTGPVVDHNQINAAKAFVDKHLLGSNLFNEEGWRYIVEKHQGRLPLVIKAVPEGSVIPTRNVLMTVENTDPKCFWLTNYVETLLMQMWYPITVATQSREIRKVILKSLEKTGDPAGIDFKLHDFGFRGVSSTESAAIGGAAHLVNFMGTDTVAGILLAQHYYGADMPGFSIPAAEHSTITSWGKENEGLAFKNMLDKFGSGPLVAVVSDSYNIYEACSELWGTKLKDQVLNMNGTLVVRPDSGHPATVVLEVLNILSEKFGYKTNEKGYKVLNDKVRVIQGDGVNYDSIKEVLDTINSFKYSTDNLAFGMGGKLLQALDRDTQKFAFKCSSVRVNGEDRDVFKETVTDPTKASKRGRLELVKLRSGDGFTYRTINTGISSEQDYLTEVFRDGRLVKEYSFDEIRNRAKEKVDGE